MCTGAAQAAISRGRSPAGRVAKRRAPSSPVCAPGCAPLALVPCPPGGLTLLCLSFIFASSTCAQASICEPAQTRLCSHALSGPRRAMEGGGTPSGTPRGGRQATAAATPKAGSKMAEWRERAPLPCSGASRRRAWSWLVGIDHTRLQPVGRRLPGPGQGGRPPPKGDARFEPAPLTPRASWLTPHPPGASFRRRFLSLDADHALEVHGHASPSRPAAGTPLRHAASLSQIPASLDGSWAGAGGAARSPR